MTTGEYQAWQDGQRVWAERAAQRRPACWSWPVTADDRRRVLAAERAGDDDALLDVLAEWQAGRCAICGRSLARLVREHDHDTGRIRGLCCVSCNGREGHSDAADVQRYRARPPAEMLGLRVVYAWPDSARALIAPGTVEALGHWQAAQDPAARR